MKIIPSLLTDDESELESIFEKCKLVSDEVHIDIADGIFCDTKTVDIDSFADTVSNIKLDFHLMVDNPINLIKKCVDVGAERIISQIELMGSQAEYVFRVKDMGCLVGLSLDLDSKISDIDENIFPNIDVLQIMSVKAGKGGQEFLPSSLEKLKLAHYIRENSGYHFKIACDGGITADVASLIDDIVDEVCVGRRIIDGDIVSNMQVFLNAIKKSNI